MFWLKNEQNWSLLDKCALQGFLYNSIFLKHEHSSNYSVDFGGWNVTPSTVFHPPLHSNFFCSSGIIGVQFILRNGVTQSVVKCQFSMLMLSVTLLLNRSEIDLRCVPDFQKCILEHRPQRASKYMKVLYFQNFEDHFLFQNFIGIF